MMPPDPARAALPAPAVGLPDPIRIVLRRAIRRARWLLFVRGLCATGAVTVLAFLVAAGADAALTLYSTWARWLLSLAAYGASAAAAAWFLARPLARSLSLAGIARLIESHHPELHECISSAVELTTSGDSPDLRGSARLIAAVVGQAAEGAQRLQPRRELGLRHIQPYLIAAMAAAALLMVLFACWPGQTMFLLTRASAPFVNLPNLRARDLAVTPGDAVLAVGESLRVEARLQDRGVRAATLHRRAKGRGDLADRMESLATPGEAGRCFALLCPAAESDFQYRVEAGDALTRFFRVRVVPPPQVDGLDIEYRYPAYTGQPPERQENVTGDLRAIAGTEVTVAARLNRPLASALVQINGRPWRQTRATVSVAGETPPTCRFSVVLARETAGRWNLRLTDNLGLRTVSVEHAVEALADAPPTAEIHLPADRPLRLPPTARIPIPYTLQDDLGLAAADLLLSVDGQARPPLPVPLPPAVAGVPLRLLRAETALALASLNLTTARRLTFQLRALDALPKDLQGPQAGLSAVYTVELDAGAPAFEQAQLQARQKELLEDLAQLRRELEAARQEARQLQEQLKQQQPNREEQDRRLDDLRKGLAAAEAKAQEIVQELANTRLQPLTPKAEEVATAVRQASDLAAAAKLADRQADRQAMVQETAAAIDRALEAARQLAEQTRPVAEEALRQAVAQDLATREEALAQARQAIDQAARPDGANQAPPPMSPQEWQRAQENVRNELTRLAAEQPGAKEALRAAGAQRATDLAEQARQLAQDQAAMGDAAKRLEEMRRLDDTARQLAQQQAQLAAEAANLPRTADEAATLRRAAEELQAGDLERAIPNQETAQQALAEDAKDAAQEPQAAAEANRIADLARRQAELTQRAEQLQAQREQLEGAHQAAQQARLLDEQQEIAQAAEAMAQEVGQRVAPEQPAAQAAAEAARQAATELDQAQMVQAARQAAQAGQQMEELADRLEAQAARPAANQQAGPPDAQQAEAAAAQARLAQEAADLAERQQGLAREMAALNEGRPEQQIATRQQDLAAEAAELAQQGTVLSQEARQLGFPPEAQGPAGQAEAELNRGQREADRAAGLLQPQANGQPPATGQVAQARQAEQAATDALNSAARNLDQLAQRLATAPTPAAPQGQQAAAAQDMAEALQAVEEATQERTAVAAAVAAAELQDLAQTMARPASTPSPASAPATPGQPAAASDSRAGTGRQATPPPSQTALRNMGLTAEDWARLPGELQDQVLQAARNPAPAEYRELIRQYFQELARRNTPEEAAAAP